MHRADHIIEPSKVHPPTNREQDSAEECADETLDRLLRAKTDEWCTPDAHAPDVREDVIADDKRRRYPEPDQTFENVVHDKVANSFNFELKRVEPSEDIISCAPRDDNNQ